MRWCKRKPALAMAGALLVTVVGGGPIVTFELYQGKVLAESRLLAARRNAYAADMSTVHEAIDNRNYRHARSLLRTHQPRKGEQDIRGWEWRYYWNLCQGDEVRTLSRHESPVYAVAVSPSGARVVSETLRPVSVLKGHNAASFGITFMPDAKRVVSSGGDGTVKLWVFGPTVGAQESVSLDAFYHNHLTRDLLSADQGAEVLT